MADKTNGTNGTYTFYTSHTLPRRFLFFAALFWGLPFPLVSAAPASLITLQFWDFPHLPKTNEYLASAMSKFEQQNPGVKIQYTRLPWQDGQQKVTLAVLSGQPPDVCGQVSNNLPQFIAQDVLEPLNADMQGELADFHPSYIEAVSFKNQIYAVPWYKACYVMALNLDVFDGCGVAPPDNGRWTWDEFLDKMKRLTTPPVNLAKVAATAPSSFLQSNGLRTYGLVTNLGPAEYEAYSIIYNFGGRILVEQPDGTVRSGVSSQDFLEGLRHLQSLDTVHHVAVPGIGASTQEQSWSLWRDSRTVACTIQGGWCVTALEQANETIARANERKRAAGRRGESEKPYRWMIAAPPSRDAQTTPVLASSGLGTFVVFKQKDARRRALAVKFAKFLVSDPGQKVLRSECVYPSRISAGNPFADDPALGPVFALFPDAVMSPVVPGGERIDRVLQQEIQKALLLDSVTGHPQATPEQAVQAGDAKVKAILERARRRFPGNAKLQLGKRP